MLFIVGDITDLAVSSNNALVASASNDYSIRVWHLPDGFPISVLRGHIGAVTAIAFSPRPSSMYQLLSWNSYILWSFAWCFSTVGYPGHSALEKRLLYDSIIMDEHFKGQRCACVLLPAAARNNQSGLCTHCLFYRSLFFISYSWCYCWSLMW